MVRPLLVLAVLLAGPAAAQETPVDLELVLAVDISGSMDDDEQAIQRNGYVAALQHPEIVAAITSGTYGRIALTYVEWAGPDVRAVVVPWRLIDSAEAAAAFAAQLAASPLATYRFTSISSGLLFAASRFETSPFEGLRRVIDVSGDGANNRGPRVDATRDVIVAAGITINGLPLLLRPSGPGRRNAEALQVYYEDCVIGGAGAFVLPVWRTEELADAIRRKLALEIAGPAPALISASAGATRPRVDCLIGERSPTWLMPEGRR